MADVKKWMQESNFVASLWKGVVYWESFTFSFDFHCFSQMWSLEFVEVADESFLKSMQKSVNRALSQCDSVDKTQNNSTKKHTNSKDLASSMLAEFKDP